MKKRKMKRIGMILMSLAIVLTMCIGTMSIAFAAGDPISATGETSLTAALTKVLRMGESTTTPNASFTFTFAQQDGVTQDSTGATIETVATTDANVPISSVTVSTDSSKTGTSDTANRIKTVEIQSSDFLASANYTRAGIYVYKVTETGNTYAIADATKESMTYSKAEYTLYVYVANKADGSGVYIKSLGTVLTKDDAGKAAGETGASSTVGNKVDPTPNPTPTTDGSVNANNSDMKFTNDYVKTQGGGGTPTDPANQSLEIGKTVTGDYGDHTKYFDFAVTLKRPAMATNTVYKGYVVDANNAVVTSADNLATADAAKLKSDANGNYIEFTLGTDGTITQNVKLKHGQRLVFSDVSVGTHFQAVETAVTNYTPTLAVKVNNATVTPTSTTDSGENIVGENKSNSAAFTNAFVDVTPTGIIMNNLPFFILIIVAIGALAAYVIIKGKKRSNSAAKH